MSHVPVLLHESIRLLDPKPGEFIIDATVDGGGLAAAILEKISPNGLLLGIDWDRRMIEKAQERIAEILKLQFPISEVVLVNDNFARLPEILKERNLGQADGLVLDLGFSSEQLENFGRGFSFQRDEPLIMTYSNDVKPVREILKELSENELAEIIRKFGEERYAKRIAYAIKQQEKIKPIETTKELVDAVIPAVPKNYEQGRIHPATRTFQALRIYANKELENLETVLKNLPEILKVGGRAAIISFHSLEDRLVKNYFRDYKKVEKLTILTKKPITASEEEIKENPRTRSAKLRCAIRR